MLQRERRHLSAQVQVTRCLVRGELRVQVPYASCHHRTCAAATGELANLEPGLPDYLWDVRGMTILNSVNLPGALSTSMLPPCCLTMMSWLIDRPSPVPSPAGLVVKNGLNIFALTSSGMPLPLSRIRISTLSPR